MKGDNGGAIDDAGTLAVVNSTFSANSGGPLADGTAQGGGINNVGNTTVVNSTFSGNSASYGGNLYSSFGESIDISLRTLNTILAHPSAGGNCEGISITGPVIACAEGNSVTHAVALPGTAAPESVTCSTGSLAAGAHSIAAVYSGDGTFHTRGRAGCPHETDLGPRCPGGDRPLAGLAPLLRADLRVRRQD